MDNPLLDRVFLTVYLRGADEKEKYLQIYETNY